MIRELIRNRLNELGISDRKFALKMGINYTTFGNYMRDQRNLPYDDLERVLIDLDLLKQP